MTELRKAAQLALEALEDVFGLEKKDVGAIQALRKALAQSKEQGVITYRTGYETGYMDASVEQAEKPPVKTYCGGKPNYCTTQVTTQVTGYVDAVPGFTATEPRQSLSRMKPGDRFVLVRTSEIYHIEKDGSQWNDTRQRPARLHKNSQVRLIVTHPKCDDACMNICTEGFTKPPTCDTPVDAINMTQERVDETAKRKHKEKNI